MSKYDREREALGLKPIGASSSFTPDQTSKYAAEREALKSGKTLEPAVPKSKFDAIDFKPVTPKDILNNIGITNVQNVEPKSEVEQKGKLGQILDAFKKLPSALFDKDRSSKISTNINEALFGKPQYDTPEEQKYWEERPTLNKLVGPESTLGKVTSKVNTAHDVFGSGLRSAMFGDTENLATGGVAPTTGNEAADAVLKAAGAMSSIAMPVGGGAPGMVGPIRNAAELAANKLVPGVNNLAGRIGNVALRGAIESLPYTAHQIGISKDITPEEALKTAGGNILYGAAGELGIEAVSSLLSKLGNIRAALKKPAAEIATDTTPVTLEKIVRPKTLEGRYTLKNKALDQAIDEYNKAIEAIQNHFGTNELRTNEIPLIKSELGIDLDSIISKMEAAELKRLPGAEEMASRRAYGVASDRAYDLMERLSRQKSNFSKVDDIKPFPTEIPTQKGTQAVKENKFARTIVESDNTLPGVKEPLKRNMPQYEPITNKDTLEKARQIVNANIDEATRIVKSSEPATAESNAIAQLLIQKAQQEGRYQDAIDLVEITARKATEQGQAIQALSMWNRLTPEGMLKYAQKVAGKLDVEDAKFITESMNKVKNMAEGSREQIVETAKVLDYIASKVPTSMLKKISTLQAMAQLLNPKTAIRNIGGNAAFAAAENVSDVLATGLDTVTSLFTGKRTTTLPSLKTQVKGFGKGFKLGLEDALKGIDTSSLKSQFDLPQITFRKGPLAVLEKAMNIELKAPDRAFYQAAYDESLRQQMKAANVSTPTKEMLENAHLDGLYRTFQDDNLASKGFSALKRELNKMTTGSKEWGLGDILLKYPKTPANLLMRGIDYSPVGIVKTLFGLTKGFNQREFVRGIARGITGTSILGAGIILYDLGILTGKKDSDKDVDALQRATGGGGYRLNLSALKRYLASGFDKEAAKPQKGDTIVSYDWNQPMAIPFAAGANIGQSKAESKPQDILGAVVASLEGGASTLAEQPLVQGVAKAFQGYDPVQAMIESVIGAPASFVPSVLNQVRQATDNVSRNVSSDSALEKSLNMVKNRLPVLSKTLPERVDTLGQTQKIMQDNNLFNVFLNPAYTSTYETRPEAQLPLDIFERTGSKEQFPRVAQKSITFKGEKINLTPEEQAQFQRYMGEFTSEQFRRLTQNASFMNMPDEMKTKIMKKVLDDSTEQAKIKLLRDKGMIK